MILDSDRENAVTLVKKAVTAGASRYKACKELGITVRTYQRWTHGDDVKRDGSPTAVRPKPRNQLSQEERQAIIEIVNSEPYGSLPPSQIVPALADEGRYTRFLSRCYVVVSVRSPQSPTTCRLMGIRSLAA